MGLGDSCYNALPTYGCTKGTLLPPRPKSTFEAIAAAPLGLGNYVALGETVKLLDQQAEE